MPYEIDFRDNIPIFLQIIDGIKIDIAKGELKAGDRILSIREMSKLLQVNPTTVGRAYQELEREGITVMKRGLGVYITEDSDKLINLKSYLAEGYISDFVVNMSSIGYKGTEIIEPLTNYLHSNEEG